MREQALAIVLLGTAIGAGTAQATESASIDPSAAPHVTKSAEGFERERDAGSFRDADELIESVTVARSRSRGNGKDGEASLAAVGAGDVWFYDAYTELFDDFDGDGYYHYLRVRFDADTLYAEQWVYARLFLSADGVNWEEYHVTDDFLIEGSSPFDDYEVETELVSGFPPGQYDVLIELYDGDFGDYLTEFGPADSSAFSLLPLEDTGYDGGEPVITVTGEHGGGGTSGLITVALLLAGAAARSRSWLTPRETDRRNARANC